jgi:hypothetical protein
MAELYLQAPLFTGATAMDQIQKILKIMGTPSQTDWPEGYQLGSKIRFNWQNYSAVPLDTLIPNASPEAIQFIQVNNFLFFICFF